MKWVGGHSVKMSQRVQQLLPKLKRLRRMNDKDRKQLIKCCDGEIVHCISECVRNLLKGNIPIKPSHLRHLSRRKQTLRKLALKKTSLVKRKQILQRGGLLGVLIQPLISGLIQLVTSYATR